ncbi:hypothetical protein CDV49_12810 [Haematobacter genomosp. 1]|uniref:Uncharacterized protein n=1 Tax=Haematobacter genomosp. 1 TaxID=366618 RepID=A0A212AA46_9RHOB|nr:hypothetical protein CDV49_12810 [Haematobacter genomosp. 1]
MWCRFLRSDMTAAGVGPLARNGGQPGRAMGGRTVPCAATGATICEREEQAVPAHAGMSRATRGWTRAQQLEKARRLEEGWAGMIRRVMGRRAGLRVAGHRGTGGSEMGRRGAGRTASAPLGWPTVVGSSAVQTVSSPHVLRQFCRQVGWTRDGLCVRPLPKGLPQGSGCSARRAGRGPMAGRIECPSLLKVSDAVPCRC